MDNLFAEIGARHDVRGPHPALRATFPIGEGFWIPRLPAKSEFAYDSNSYVSQ